MDSAADSSRGPARPSASRGRVLIVIAAILWSTSGLFAKAPWFDNWSVEDRGLGLAFWRGAFATLWMLPFVRRISFRWEMIPMGLAFSAMIATFLTSMVLGSESNAIWLQYLGPAWVVIAGQLGIGDRAKRGEWGLILAAIGGVAFILAFEIQGQRPMPAALAILSGLAFAAVLILMRRVSHEDGAWLMIINHSASALVLAPWVLTRLPLPTPWQFLVLVVFAGMQLGLPYLLFARALRRVPSHEAGLLSLIEPIMVPVWTFLVWRHAATYQPPDWWTMVGGACILAGLVNRYWPVKGNREGS